MPPACNMVSAVTGGKMKNDATCAMRGRAFYLPNNGYSVCRWGWRTDGSGERKVETPIEVRPFPAHDR